MRNIKRSLTAAPAAFAALVLLTAILSVSPFGGGSIAAITSAGHKASSETTLSRAGFLDFKTILYSPDTGDNLAGVFNQIEFVGPDMFKGASLSPSVLRKFKSSQRPLLPSNPVWGWDETDLDVMTLDKYSSPQSISPELVDAMLLDITNQIRNHGVSWMLTPAIGPSTTAYFNSATRQVIDQIEKLENRVKATPAESQGKGTSQPSEDLPHPQPVFIFGLGLIAIGLLRRRSRKKSLQNNQPPVLKPAPRTADPIACIMAIRNSPIRYSPPYSAKTV